MTNAQLARLEAIKLSATAANNFGVGLILGGCILPLFTFLQQHGGEAQSSTGWGRTIALGVFAIAAMTIGVRFRRLALRIIGEIALL